MFLQIIGLSDGETLGRIAVATCKRIMIMNWIKDAFGPSFKVGKPYISIDGQAVGGAMNQIIELDFKGYQEFINTIETITCVVVAGSNLEKGTFSHLTDKVDVLDYSRQLAKVWGRERPRLGLVGGDELYDPTDFPNRLELELVNQGFGIAGKIVGGRGIERRVRMASDKLLVVETGYRVDRRDSEIRF